MMQHYTESFEAQRSTLISMAYQMLGERAAAEDIVQEAWVLWDRADKETINSPAAWLRRVTSRLAIDTLRSAHSRREVYVGPWLPEPLLSEGSPPPEDAFSLAKERELALLWAMERLSPDERSAFILRSVFDSDYDEIAGVLNKTESACRKIVSRAKQQLKETKTRFSAEPEETAQMLRLFSQACISLDHDEVLKLLAPNVIALTDGGGKVRAALRPLRGAQEVTQVIMSLSARLSSQEGFRFTTVNGQPAFAISGTQGFDMISTVRLNKEGLIDWIYVMRNPDKLPTVY